MLGKLKDKYHIIFITDTVFNAAVLCTTSVLQFLLLPQIQKKGKRYNNNKTSRPFRNAKYVDGFIVNTSVKGISKFQKIYETNTTTNNVKHNKF
jgi:hypothetical protein